MMLMFIRTLTTLSFTRKKRLTVTEPKDKKWRKKTQNNNYSIILNRNKEKEDKKKKNQKKCLFPSGDNPPQSYDVRGWIYKTKAVGSLLTCSDSLLTDV